MSIEWKNPNIRKHMFEGNFGLEKESLRVTSEGFLSHTKHPFPDNPNIERDFCENQTELITNVESSVDAVWEAIASLHRQTVQTLLHLETGQEFLWPFSSPPYMKGEDDIPIASYKEEHLRGKELYREYLAQKYGKRRMLFSGIHFNFSFSDALLEAGYEQSEMDSFREYKDSLYLELATKITRYSWLIVYLTAASPLMDGSFFDDGELGKTVFKNLSSPRCSEIGYWNEFEPILAYDSLENYVRSIEEYVEQGQLKSASELYYPVRLKPKGENSLENLKQSGVNHIELRMLDLNPLEPVGICKADLEFLHRLILYVLSLEDREFETYEQVMAIQNEKRAAQYEEESLWIETGWDTKDFIKPAALEILTDMEAFYQEIGSPESVEVVKNQRLKIENPQKRYAAQVVEQFQTDYVKQGVELAAKYAGAIDSGRV